MLSTANRPLPAILTKLSFTTAVDTARPLIVPGPLWRAALAVGNLVATAAIVLCIPLAILALGIPIALGLRLLLWLAGLA